MTSRARIQSVDALKGVAILGVLFIHMAFTARFDSAALSHVKLLQNVSAWCVLAFFFASGVLHACNDSDCTFTGFVRRRAVRLLIPCAAFTWLCKLLLLAANACGFLTSESVAWPATASGLLSFVFVPAAPQFYFLAHLFAIAVIIHLLLKMRLLGNPVVPWIGAGALLQAYWLLPLEKPHGEALTQLPIYTAIYLAGFGFASAGEKNRIPCKTRLGLLFFITATIAVGMKHEQALHAIVPPLLILVLSLAPASGISPPAWLGRKSGVIYAWHTPILMPALSLLLAKTPLNGWLLVASMTILAITGSLLVGSVVAIFDRRGWFRI